MGIFTSASVSYCSARLLFIFYSFGVHHEPAHTPNLLKFTLWRAGIRPAFALFLQIAKIMRKNITHTKGTKQT